MSIKSSVFIIISLVLSFVSGLGTIHLFGDYIDTGDLKKSMIRLILSFLIVSFLSISSIGFIQVKVSGTGNYWNGVASCLGGLIIGQASITLPLPPQIIGLMIVAFGVLGFNIGLTKKTN